jgi:23S rRNA (adenine2503-C2)-methyltransferase
MNSLQAITEYNLESLTQALIERGEATRHARVVLETFYQSNGAPSFTSPPLSKTLVKALAESNPRQATLLQRAQSSDGTVKLLVGFARGSVESVLMPAYREGVAAVCVSSQVGCAMGCDFCASTKMGFTRNLTAAEIMEQFLFLRAEAAAQNRKIKTLVFMGMGEPMHNLEQVQLAIERLAAQHMGGLGWKNITVSTVGIIPGIEKLSQMKPHVPLALSLHAPDDETRGRLVPMNKKYGVQEIIDAVKKYAEVTNTVVTLEYCMLAGVNDSDAQAKLLAERLKGFRAHVNLIPYNTIGVGLSGVEYQKPTRERLYQFMGILHQNGVVAHFRGTRGDDVAAACGQLAATQSTPR